MTCEKPEQIQSYSYQILSRVPLFKGGLVNLQEYTLAQAHPYNVLHSLSIHRVDPKIELMYTVDSMLLVRYIDPSAIGKDYFEKSFRNLSHTSSISLHVTRF